MIGDKADAADRPDVYVGRDISGIWQLATLETFEADEITEAGVFPEFGDFIKVYEVDRDGIPADDPAYLSLYVDLDRQLVELVEEAGDTISIEAVRETRDGGYTMDVDLVASESPRQPDE